MDPGCRVCIGRVNTHTNTQDSCESSCTLRCLRSNQIIHKCLFIAFCSQAAQLWPADSSSPKDTQLIVTHSSFMASVELFLAGWGAEFSITITVCVCVYIYIYCALVCVCVCSYVDPSSEMWLVRLICFFHPHIKQMNQTMNLSPFINLWPLAFLPIISLTCAMTLHNCVAVSLDVHCEAGQTSRAGTRPHACGRVPAARGGTARE